MPASGGIIPNNIRQGYRAEYLAKYIISEFGPCERINPENDYGLDLIATIMQPAGSMGTVSSMYGIQVKSGKAEFSYSGDQLFDWIKSYSIPILMCRANREAGSVRLYSTWTLHDLVLGHSDASIRQISFIEQPESNDNLRMPEVKDQSATVWLGKPIVEISAEELHRKEFVTEIRKTLAEWIGFDTENYFRRSAGIPIIFGYLTWQVNQSLDASRRLYVKPHYFGSERTRKALTLIQDCAAVIAFHQGLGSDLTKDLAIFVKKHGVEIPDFTKHALGI